MKIFLTYGDGLSNLNIKSLLQFHKKSKKIATVTAVRPPARFGELKIKNTNLVSNFDEKNQINTGWINGGFFVFNSQVFNFIPKSNTMLERNTMVNLTRKKQIVAFKHLNFWQCMDNLRDKNLLNSIWKKQKTLVNMKLFYEVYKGRRVLVTGHTGFKGSWLTLWLLQL